MLQHLRLAVPAAAGVLWLLQRLRGKAAAEPTRPALASSEDEGAEVAVELPVAGRGPQLPYVAPPALKAVLLDVTLPLALPALWLAAFHSSAALLADFHRQLGDLDVAITPWLQKAGSSTRRRILRYTTPLKNPLGPRQARNTEVLEAVHLGATGFTLRARCVSEGVPFASTFANHVQWTAVPCGVHSCRLVVTGECQFQSPVWGPLKGQIERESVKGMTNAYRMLIRILERQYAGVAADTTAAAAPLGSGRAGAKPAAAAATARGKGQAQGQQGALAGHPLALDADARGGRPAAAMAAAGAHPEGFNPAALLMVVVLMALLWRLAVMQPLALQAARGVVAAVAGR